MVGAVGMFLSRHAIPVLQPAGQIGVKERNLMVFGAALSLVVVVPVFTLLGVIAWKYREDNATKQKYTPEADGNRWAETTWWLIPTLLLIIISTITWRSSYALDPFKPLNSTQKPLTIQVIALDWKWLFIYPQQNIASVNQLVVPAGTPLDLHITSDTVMNSFWLPALGGQMYAMPGMSTQLHLVADKTGTYSGSSANISGPGFAGMRFTARAMPLNGFNSWVRTQQKRSTPMLDWDAYVSLAKPTQNVPVSYYAKVMPGLYNRVVMDYMMPMSPSSPTAAPQAPLTGKKM